MTGIPRESCFQVPKFHGMLWNEYTGKTAEPVRVAKVGDAKVAGYGDGYMPEMFHRLYADQPNEIPAEKRGPAAAVRARLHNLASELPEFETLRKQTVRDPLWSGMAATAISEQVAVELPARKQNDPPPDAESADRILDGLRDLLEQGAATEEQVGKAAGEAFGEAEATAEQAEGLDESAVRQALRRAVGKAQETIDEAQAAFSALGYGTGMGTGAGMNPGVALELARKVASSAKLRKIIELAGRVTATARAKRATRSEYARSELAGVEQTGDVARLLPSEMGALGDPTRSTDLLRRLVERTALGYKLRGRDKTARGPLVMAIDQSGSMGERDKDAWAKAVALALLDTARTEKRSFGIILYNGGVAASHLFVDPMAVDPNELLRILSVSPAGGTAFGPPMTLALDWIEQAAQKGGKIAKADIVHVTDGDASPSGAVEFKARADKLGVHVYGIGIDCTVSVLGQWSHEVTRIDDVSRDSKALDLIFDHV